MENKPITVGEPPIAPGSAPEFLDHLFAFLEDDENDPLYEFSDEELGLDELMQDAEEVARRLQRRRRLRWVEQAREKEVQYKARRLSRRACMQSLSDAAVRSHPALKAANFRGLEGKVEELPREQLIEIILDYELDDDA